MSFDSPTAVKYLRGQSTDRRPFIPIVGTLAAAINQSSREEFLSDATQMANGLQRAQRLFDLDAVCVVPDPVLVAEGLGLPVRWDDERGQFAAAERFDSVEDFGDPSGIAESGRIPIVLEATSRLVTSTEDDVAVFGVLPGLNATFEATFGESLSGDDERIDPIRTATEELARAFGQENLDGYLLMESAIGDDPASGVVDAVTGLLEVVGNIGEFFGASVGIALDQDSSELAETLATVDHVDAVFVDGPEFESVSKSVDEARVGGGIGPQLLEQDEDRIEDQLADFPDDAFLASGTEVPSDVHPGKLHAVREVADSLSSGG